MSHPVKGVDHVFLLVNDLERSAARFGDLGFTVSPLGLHSEAKGTANHTIMFPDDYFELLGILRPTDLNETRRDALEKMGEGLHAISCRIDSAEQAAADLNELGIATHGLGSFERPVPLPDGSEGIAAFSTVSFSPGEVPFGTVFMCQHRTRETVWLPELIDHANTACGLGGILALSQDPVEDATRFARLWANGQVSEQAGGARIETGPNSAPLVLMSKAALTERFPGVDIDATPKGAFAALQIRVKDMQAVRDCLDRAGVSATPTRTGLAVPADKASGAILEFIPA